MIMPVEVAGRFDPALDECQRFFDDLLFQLLTHRRRTVLKRIAAAQKQAAIFEDLVTSFGQRHERHRPKPHLISFAALPISVDPSSPAPPAHPKLTVAAHSLAARLS